MKHEIPNTEADLIQEGSGQAKIEGQNKEEEQSSYRQIFKATSLFGGVQVFNILIGIIRVKFVAILLGTTGVGIMGLLNAPLELIVSITGLGIAFSAVRDISEAHVKGNGKDISNTIITLRRWTWFTGLLGAIVTLSLAPLLSKWTFGSSDYTWAFVWLSITLLLRALSSGNQAVLQGVRRLKDLAKSGVIGSALGLVTSIPLYYFYGLRGIVPSLIIAAVTGLTLSWHYSRKVPVQKIVLSAKDTWLKGRVMAKLGISMTLAGFIATLSTYILNAYISNKGGVEQVGLYNAGWGIVGQYTGIVFTAMATDYFPRLSAVQSDNKKVKELVGQQGETALLIMAPLLTLLIVTMPFVIRALYTSAFLPIVMFANLTVLGMQFKAISWAMGYVYLAKGDGKLFLLLEIVAGTLILIANLLFYRFYGLNGLGVSFVISFFLGSIVSYTVLKSKYQFSFSRKFYGIFLISYGLVVSSFVSIYIHDVILRYVVGVFVLVLATAYSLYKLNELMDVKRLIMNRFKSK